MSVKELLKSRQKVNEQLLFNVNDHNMVRSDYFVGGRRQTKVEELGRQWLSESESRELKSES